MPTRRFSFDAPPVVEVVISAQFAPIPNLGAAHAGRYWQTLIDRFHDDWAQAWVTHSLPLDDVFESPEPAFGRLAVSFSDPETSPPRVQISDASRDRMLQIQSSRFIYNWRQQKDEYPTFDQLKAEFDEKLNLFLQSLSTWGMPNPVFNQWEVTYVNHIPKGKMWSAVSDWAQIFPWLKTPPATDGAGSNLQVETQNGIWRFQLPDQRGRLHVALSHARTQQTGASEPREVASLTLTARGGVSDKHSVDDGISRGHDAIIRSFEQMTSPLAHSAWGLRREQNA